MNPIGTKPAILTGTDAETSRAGLPVLAAILAAVVWRMW
jgi:hypothetical protein